MHTRQIHSIQLGDKRRVIDPFVRKSIVFTKRLLFPFSQKPNPPPPPPTTTTTTTIIMLTIIQSRPRLPPQLRDSAADLGPDWIIIAGRCTTKTADRRSRSYRIWSRRACPPPKTTRNPPSPPPRSRSKYAPSATPTAASSKWSASLLRKKSRPTMTNSSWKTTYETFSCTWVIFNGFYYFILSYSFVFASCTITLRFSVKSFCFTKKKKN